MSSLRHLPYSFSRSADLQHQLPPQNRLGAEGGEALLNDPPWLEANGFSLQLGIQMLGGHPRSLAAAHLMDMVLLILLISFHISAVSLLPGKYQALLGPAHLIAENHCMVENLAR